MPSTLLHDLDLAGWRGEVAARIVKDVGDRLRFLKDVGLDYLTLDRSAETLSGGEAQRIRLASQVGSGLTGVMYILDEPSIGLHQRDNARLLGTLAELRDTGNTVIVVEHDDRRHPGRGSSSWTWGPAPACTAAKSSRSGTPDEIKRNPASLTGQYLSGARSIAVPTDAHAARSRTAACASSAPRGNNLRNVDVEIPLGTVHLRHRAFQVRANPR